MFKYFVFPLFRVIFGVPQKNCSKRVLQNYFCLAYKIWIQDHNPLTRRRFFRKNKWYMYNGIELQFVRDPAMKMDSCMNSFSKSRVLKESKIDENIWAGLIFTVLGNHKYLHSNSLTFWRKQIIFSMLSRVIPIWFVCIPMILRSS